MKLAKFLFTSSFNELVLFENKLVAIQTLFISSTSSIESILFAILFAISRKQIFWVQIASKFASSKLSRLLRFISKFLSISLLISTTKTYLTMNNLFVMFVEKSKLIDLLHRQKILFFSKNWRFNKFNISRQTRITSYFLSSFNSFKFEVFSKAFFYLFIQTNAFRRRHFVANIFFCEQNSNFALESALINTIIKSIKNDFFKTIYNDRKTTRLSFTFVTLCRVFSTIICFFSSFLTFFCFFRICRFCYDIFNFNNDLHRHLRFNHLSFTSRRRHEKTWNTWEKVRELKIFSIILIRASFRDF